MEYIQKTPKHTNSYVSRHPKGAMSLTLAELQTILVAHNVEYASGMKKADVVAKVDELGFNAAD